MAALKPKVAVIKTARKPNGKEIEAAVRKAVELSGGLAGIVKKGKRVLIKPNLVIAKPVESAVVTDPRVCRVLADMVRELGGNPFIAESSGVGFDTEEAIEAAGYGKLRKEGYEVVDLKSKSLELVTVPIPKGKSLKEATIPKIVLEADVIIDVPKMKTHDQTLVTLSLKNLKGLLTDKGKRSLHHQYGVFQGCADVASLVKPRLSVVDGILAMEGLGPAMGDALEMDLIIAGRDIVAVDAVTAYIMGCEPLEDGCIRAAAESGLGVADLKKIELAGEPIEKLRRRFKRAEEAMGEIPFPADFKIIMDEKACSGCKLTVMEVFMDVQKANQLDRAAGWTMITGKVDRLPDTGKLIFVGSCTAKYRNKGVFVPGCPPNNRDVCEGLKAMGMDIMSGVAKTESLE